MTTAEKILNDCSGDKDLQIYALSNALSVTEKELAAMAAERDEYWERLRIEEECRQGNKRAVVDTVGGMVEGHPTHTLNYLQRLRELVRKEKILDSLQPNQH